MLPTVEQSNSLRKESNAITQSMPSIMVVPSDALLKRMGCLKEEKTMVKILFDRIDKTEKLLK